MSTPDIMTVAKGITNAAIPMGGVFVKRGIHDAMMQGPEHIIELFHGYTYSVILWPALRDLPPSTSITARDFWNASRASRLSEEAVHSLRGSPHVIDIRNIGLVAGIELEPRADGAGKRTYDVFLDCLQNGVLIRQSGDIIALSPPLIVEESQIQQIVDHISVALRRVH